MSNLTTDFKKNIPLWETLESEEIFLSKWLSLKREKCRLPGGKVINDYQKLILPDGVAIVAVTLDNELVLVRQYKHGLGRVVLELPAGNVESEESHTAIIRELKEETGYVADKVEFITTVASKPARMTGLTHIYFASDVTYQCTVEQSDIELIETVLIPVSELPQLIRSRRIITETSLAGILSVLDKLQ